MHTSCCTCAGTFVVSSLQGLWLPADRAGEEVSPSWNVFMLLTDLFKDLIQIDLSSISFQSLVILGFQSLVMRAV